MRDYETDCESPMYSSVFDLANYQAGRQKNRVKRDWTDICIMVGEGGINSRV